MGYSLQPEQCPSRLGPTGTRHPVMQMCLRRGDRCPPPEAVPTVGLQPPCLFSCSRHSFTLQNRPLYLTAFSFLAWSVWAFTLVVCVWLWRRQNGSGERYGWVIGGLTIGSFILFIGLPLAQSPPEVPSEAVSNFLTFGALAGRLPQLGFRGSIWVFLHVGGFFFLLLAVKSIVFLGLGTVAHSLDVNRFWAWLSRVMNREARHPRLACISITACGVFGLVCLGGWGYDLFLLLLHAGGVRTD